MGVSIKQNQDMFLYIERVCYGRFKRDSLVML